MPTLTDKLELAKKLGLKQQERIADAQIRQKEIQSIINTEQLREVTIKSLHTLFGTNPINKKITKHFNIITNIHIVCGSICLLFCISCFTILPLNFDQAATFITFSALITIFFIGGIFVRKENGPKLILLSFEKIKDYTDDIPMGGLLKLEEVNTKIQFDDIFIVKPEIKITNDPAIVGKIGFKHYLIYAWDMDKDIDNLDL
jgi:hypothetical protein